MGENDGEDTFMHSYADALNNELKNTTLKNSFVRANEESSKKIEVCFLSLHERAISKYTWHTNIEPFIPVMVFWGMYCMCTFLKVFRVP